MLVMMIDMQKRKKAFNFDSGGFVGRNEDTLLYQLKAMEWREVRDTESQKMKH